MMPGFPTEAPVEDCWDWSAAPGLLRICWAKADSAATWAAVERALKAEETAQVPTAPPAPGVYVRDPGGAMNTSPTPVWLKAVLLEL